MLSSSAFVGHFASTYVAQLSVSSRSTVRSIPLGSCSEKWVGQQQIKFCRMYPRLGPLWLISRSRTSDPGQLPPISYHLLKCSSVDFDGGGQDSGKGELGIVDEGSSASAVFVGSSSADSLRHTSEGVSGTEDQLPTFPKGRKRGRPKGSTSKKNGVIEDGTSKPQTTVRSESQGAIITVDEVAAADPEYNPSTSIRDSSIKGQPDGAATPEGVATSSSKEGERPQEVHSDVMLLDDRPPPARRINIARAATAAKKNAVSAKSNSDESSAIEFSRNSGRQKRAGRGRARVEARSGAGERAGAGAGAVANSVVYTGRAFSHKRRTRTSRQQSWRTRDRDRGVLPPVEPLTLRNSGSEDVDDTKRQRMPLLERAEVNAIMAASAPQGFPGAEGVFDELDASMGTNAAMLALMEDGDVDDLDDLVRGVVLCIRHGARDIYSCSPQASQTHQYFYGLVCGCSL